MAIQCKYCGTDLPKNDARFCNNCGMLVPSHPFSPQSLSTSKNDPKSTLFSFADQPPENHKRVLREQIAELSPARSQSDRLEQGRPGEMLSAKEPEVGQLETHQDQFAPLPEVSADHLASPMEAAKLPETPQPGVQRDASSEEGVAYKQISPLVYPRRLPGVKRRNSIADQENAVQAPAWPTPLTHVSMRGTSEQGKPEGQNAFSPSAPLNQHAASAPVHELQGNVQEAEMQRTRSEGEEPPIEDLPTRAVVVPSRNQPAEPGKAIEEALTRSMGVPLEKQAPEQEREIEDIPTRSFTIPPENRPFKQEPAVETVPTHYSLLSAPHTQSVPPWLGMEERSAQPGTAFNAAMPTEAFTNAAVSQGYQPTNMATGVAYERGSDAPVLPRRSSRSRWPIIIVAFLLLILVLGGVGGWIILSQQQANVNLMTQPQVSFSDPQLGVSLSYPNGWTKKVDTARSTASFYASNHIGEVDLLVTDGSGNMQQSLEQQATKMGLSGTKAGATLTVAGVAWQQMQGTMQQDGAKYVDTILATAHGGKAFIVVQQAPQNNYADWEKDFFAPMRDSLKFLS